MNIIQKQQNPSGAYPPIQSWNGAVLPDGYYQVADGVELSCGGFGVLTVEDDVVTAFTGDAEAFEAWRASLPDPGSPEPNIEEQVKVLTAQLKAAQESNTFLEDCIVEMADIVYA